MISDLRGSQGLKLDLEIEILAFQMAKNSYRIHFDLLVYEKLHSNSKKLDFPSILYLRNYSNNKNVENDEKMSAEQHFVLFLWGNDQIFLGHFNENIF